MVTSGCRASSIQESEEPEGDAVAVAHLCLVCGEEAVGLVLDLLETLAGATDLKEVLAADEEVTLFRILYRVHGLHLAGEECLAQCAHLALATEGVHQVGVTEEEFVGGDQLLVVLQFGGEQVQYAGLVEGIEHFEARLAGALQCGAELVYVGLERKSLGDDHQQPAGFLNGLEGHVLHGGEVALHHCGYHTLQALVEGVRCLAVEWIGTMVEVVLKVALNLDGRGY